MVGILTYTVDGWFITKLRGKNQFKFSGRINIDSGFKLSNPKEKS